MNINLTLLMQAAAFAAFIWFTARFVWPPLMRAIEARSLIASITRTVSVIITSTIAAIAFPMERRPRMAGSALTPLAATIPLPRVGARRRRKECRRQCGGRYSR